MAWVAPGLVQGLAAGFGGEQRLTELAMKKLQLKAGQEALQTQEEQTSANKVWSRAIMDVLAGAAQNPQIAPPISPAPGQASVPMTQGTAGVPAQPGQSGPPSIPTPQTPSPAAALLTGQPIPGSAGAPSIGPPPAPTYQQLDVSNILKSITTENPNLPPGVLASVVNDHILPLMDAQSQQNYKNFQQQLELSKLDNTQQDKMLTLYFKYDQLQQTMADRAISRQDRDMLLEASLSIKQEMVDIMKPVYESQIAEHQARAASLTGKAAAEAKLPPAEKQKYDQLKNKYNMMGRLQSSADLNGEADRSALLQSQMDDVQKQMDDLIDSAAESTGGGVHSSNPGASTSGTDYKTQDDVVKAYKDGSIDYDTAAKILQDKFGVAP